MRRAPNKDILSLISHDLTIVNIVAELFSPHLFPSTRVLLPLIPIDQTPRSAMFDMHRIAMCGIKQFDMFALPVEKHTPMK